MAFGTQAFGPISGGIITNEQIFGSILRKGQNQISNLQRRKQRAFNQASKLRRQIRRENRAVQRTQAAVRDKGISGRRGAPAATAVAGAERRGGRPSVSVEEQVGLIKRLLGE